MRNDDKQETRSETDSCERLSTKSEQLTSEGNATNLALHFLKPPVFSQLDQSLCEQVNRHMVLDLFVKSARSVSLDEQVSTQVARDVHKTLQVIAEEDLTKDLFEEAFLLSRLNSLLAPAADDKLYFQTYPKLPKILRIVTILMMQSNSEACNRDKVQLKLLQLLDTVIKYYKQIKPAPFD
jgi:hypothetical protein